MVAMGNGGKLVGRAPGDAVCPERLWELLAQRLGSVTLPVPSMSLPSVHVLDDAPAADPPHRQWLQPSARGPVGFWNHQRAGECLVALDTAHVAS